MSFHRTRATVFAGIASAMLVLAAAAQQEEEEKRPVVETRVYDIRDLLFQHPPHPAPATLVPPTRLGEPTTRPAEAVLQPASNICFRQPIDPSLLAAKIDELRSLIMDTVDADGWRDNGGTVGSLREIDGKFVVRQSAQNHAGIDQLLSQLREASTQMVTVRADWVFLSAADVRAIGKPSERDAALTEIDRAMLDKLAEETVAFAGRITGFNGQTVHIASGRAKSVAAPTTQPSALLVQSGLLLEVTPVLTPDAETAMLDIQSVASDWESAPSSDATTRPAAPPPVPGGIDMMVHHFRTSVALPTGKPVLIGGMSYDPSQPKVANNRGQLYLIVEVNASKAKPGPARVLPAIDRPILN